MKEIDPASLPSVIAARAQQRAVEAERAPNYDRDAADAAWMEQVTAAAIAKEEGARPAPEIEQESESETHRFDPLRATERAVERAQFQGRYDELRAAAPTPEVVHLFEAGAARAAEPPAMNFDRDGANAAWQEKVAAAGIASDAARAAQEGRQPAEPAVSRETRAGAGEPSHAPPEAQEAAREIAPEPGHGMRDLDGIGGRFLGGLGKAIMSFISQLGDFIAPPARLTKDQAERAEHVADEQRDQQDWAAYERAVEDHRDRIAEQQRSRDIARTLRIDSVGDPEEERFRSIMQRAARDREQDYERER